MQIDKKAHILAGAAIAGTLAAYGVPTWCAFWSAVTIGALKEVWDAMGRGTPDRWDFIATALGATVILPMEML
jgi:hypothetical protein